MVDEDADSAAKQSQQAKGTYLEHPCFEIIRDVHQTIGWSSLRDFTFSLLDTLWQDLSFVVQNLEHLPEKPFKEMVEVVLTLTEARNELRLARFLFEVEEIHPVYRLIMRNRAVLRGQDILRKVLMVWPLEPS